MPITLEPLIGSGTSHIRQSVSDDLVHLPNIQSTLDGTSIKVESERQIQLGHIGAYRKRAAPEYTDDIVDEHEYGKQVVAGVNQLLQETFRGKNELNMTLAPEVFSRTSLQLEELFKNNDELQRMLGEIESSDYSQKSVLPSKGIPIEVGRAITVAAANHILKTIRESSTQEAEAIDGGYVEAQKSIYQAEIGRLEADVQEKGRTLAERQEAHTQSEKKKNETGQVFSALDGTKVKVVGAIADKFKIPSTEISTAFSAADLQFIKREGTIIKKHSVNENNFNKLDQEIMHIFGNIEELKSFDLSVDSASSLVIGVVEKLIDTYFPESSTDGDALALYSRANNILRGILPNNDLSATLDEQLGFFSHLKSSKKAEDQTAAKALAKGFLARAICLQMAKHPGQDGHDRQLSPIINGLRNGLTNSLEQTKTYIDTKRNKKEAEEVDQTKARELGETQYLHNKLGEELSYNKRYLEELETKKSERIDALRAKMATELFVSTKGHAPSEEELKGWEPYHLNHIIFNSRLLTDTVASLFKGLPICLPEQDRETFIENYLRRSYSTHQPEYIQKHFMASVDYLPQMVKNILPEKTPNADLASDFVASMVRDYPSRKQTDSGSLLGTRLAQLPIFKDDRENHRYDRYTNTTRDLVRGIALGGELVEIPETEVPKVNLQLMRDTRWTGDEAESELATKARSFKEWLKQNAPPGSLVVSMELFRRPTEESRYWGVRKSDELLAAKDPKSLFDSSGVFYFDEYPRIGAEAATKMAPVYVIKAAKPPESRY